MTIRTGTTIPTTISAVLSDLGAGVDKAASSTSTISYGGVTTCTVLVIKARLSLIRLISAMGSVVATTTVYNKPV
jgi:hypothetical protein